MKRRLKVIEKNIIEFIKKKHKQISPFLTEAKIYVDTILAIGFSIATFAVSIKACDISKEQTALSERQMELVEIQTELTKTQTELTKKQTELTEMQEKIAERQIELSEKEYKQDYFPRLVLRSVDRHYSDSVNFIMNYYNGEDCFSDDGDLDLNLFSEFDEDLFKKRKFYSFIQRSDELWYYFMEAMDLPEEPSILSHTYISEKFNREVLDVTGYKKEILNSEFQELLLNSKEIYTIENVGGNASNLSAEYFIIIRISFAKNGHFTTPYYIGIYDENYNYDHNMDNMNIINLDAISPIYDESITNLEQLIKQEFEGENISIHDNKYICLRYSDVDNEGFADYYLIYNNGYDNEIEKDNIEVNQYLNSYIAIDDLFRYEYVNLILQELKETYAIME